MKFKTFFILIVTLVLFIPQFSFAESIKVKTRVLPDKITLGGETRLFIEASLSEGESLEPPSREANLSPFEIKAVENRPGQIVLTLTAFELGDLTVPPVTLIHKDGSGRKKTVKTQSVKVKVVGVPKRPGEGKDIRPIKGPVSLNAQLIKDLALGLAALILFAVLCVKIILRRRRKKLEDLESLKSPHERAELELGRLFKKNFLEEGRVKEFYSELADILRRYLERQVKVEALESTTFEILRRLKEKEFDPEAVAKIKNILENSDLVKFAKFIPPRLLADSLADELRAVVQMTKPREEASPKKGPKA